MDKCNNGRHFFQFNQCVDREHACVLRLFKRLVWTDHPSLTKSWCLTWLFRTSNPMKIKVHLLCQRVITKGSSS
ncbi:hypothetical protein HanRHA438_Chr04g0170301 [Helianthus annuus]|nr:hypothetical protein HanHA300_Chr12g0461371 [Helianthus annuus]KAJ0506849.1 hypothetical protein HanHA89_Chr12g0486771 [Helianthus annuus]KAJ0580662.1 hypothetical protein HanHA300_Chr04g0131821 [Helianthus annuus]KAJ0588297.1 hypothetical protein HanIR_Chr04g0172931 [Helianthus annuus]KAJ0596613.1 hypothetical protein HanHA89_Chr04g0144801 [Helianthus annuus]